MSWPETLSKQLLKLYKGIPTPSSFINDDWEWINVCVAAHLSSPTLSDFSCNTMEGGAWMAMMCTQRAAETSNVLRILESLGTGESRTLWGSTEWWGVWPRPRRAFPCSWWHDWWHSPFIQTWSLWLQGKKRRDQLKCPLNSPPLPSKVSVSSGTVHLLVQNAWQIA